MGNSHKEERKDSRIKMRTIIQQLRAAFPGCSLCARYYTVYILAHLHVFINYIYVLIVHTYIYIYLCKSFIYVNTLALTTAQ